MNQDTPPVINLKDYTVEPTEAQLFAKFNKRVVVIIPSHDMVHADFMMRLVTMAHQFTMGPDYCILGYVNQHSSIIHAGRQTALDEARAAYASFKPTHYFWLDSDMGFPPSALARLLAHNKDMVGCDYPMRKHPYSPTASLTTDHKKVPYDTKGLVEVAGLGFGCCLIAEAALEGINAPHFAAPWGYNDGSDKPVIMGEDYFFCTALRNAGRSIWCDYDLSRELLHYGQMGYSLTFSKNYAANLARQNA